MKHLLIAVLLSAGITAQAQCCNDSIISSITDNITATAAAIDSLTQDTAAVEETSYDTIAVEDICCDTIDNSAIIERQRRINFLRQVYDKAVYVQNISSKIDLGIRGMGKDVTLDGKLQMRRGKVIRLTIVPFGLMEVARLEFTPTYVLLIDRIHKEYVKASYNEVAFLKTEGLTFYTLQSLFWNELFQPGKAKLSDSDLALYTTTDNANGGKTVGYRQDKMSFTWATDSKAFIKATDIAYGAGTKYASNVKVTYDDFTPVGVKSFPKKENITFNTKAFSTGTMSLNISMGNISTDSNWDATTNVSGSYKQISAEEFFTRLSKL